MSTHTICFWRNQKNTSVICLKKKAPYLELITLVLLSPDMPAFANSVDPDQLASMKPTDLDLHCLPFTM